MSELIDNTDNRATIRWKLLTGASALALAAYVSGTSAANAAKTEAAERPLFWIELGGQVERVDGKEDPFVPPFARQTPLLDIYSPFTPGQSQKFSIYQFGEEGKITFRPSGSKWSFSASLRYGRTSKSRYLHQQHDVTSQYPNPFAGATSGQPATRTLELPLFADLQGRNREHHAIVDFQAGRDVGLGSSVSNAALGVRAVDFASRSKIGMIARPDGTIHVRKLGRFYLRSVAHTDYMASGYNDRSFHGIGPSISWSGDIAIAGNDDDAITLDWGVNAAVLFGRQHAKGTHKTSANYYKGGSGNYPPSVYNNPPLPHDRSRSVLVPNAGATLAISYRYPGAKVSFGYRADMFFDAMDMGVDMRDTKNRAFYGPFATISIGIGD